MGTRGNETQKEPLTDERPCVIFAAGELDAGFDVSTYTRGAYIICADGGYDRAIWLGVRPDLFVGDMDSVKSRPSGCEMVLSPAEKDDTDTMLAVKLAIERGYRSITILGALGGRLDHTLANLQTLVYCAKQGVKARLEGAPDSAFVMIDQTVTLAARQGFVSVFSVSERCEGVTLQGLKYPLHNATVTNSFPVGVSNEFAGELGVISVEKGCLLVVLSRDRQAL